MGLLRRLLFAPVTAPTDTAVWVAKKIHETAEKEMNDPATIRKALVELEAQLLAGEIDDDAYDEAENTLLTRLGMLS